MTAVKKMEIPEVYREQIPPNPCNGCVPPKRTSECHATCNDYLAWEANKNRIVKARWEYEESIRYTSYAMSQFAKRNQMSRK